MIHLFIKIILFFEKIMSLIEQGCGIFDHILDLDCRAKIELRNNYKGKT